MASHAAEERAINHGRFFLLSRFRPDPLRGAGREMSMGPLLIVRPVAGKRQSRASILSGSDFDATRNPIRVDETDRRIVGRPVRPTPPLGEDVDEYFQWEVVPHVPDTWIDHDTT